MKRAEITIEPFIEGDKIGLKVRIYIRGLFASVQCRGWTTEHITDDLLKLTRTFYFEPSDLDKAYNILSHEIHLISEQIKYVESIKEKVYDMCNKLERQLNDSLN